ncbi:MAG: HAD-IIA family hydrolase [Armatimonadota bacterium]|nr:HAD-IIA family hydrolase [Armatimonadota bacterium]MDR7563994.1 HAD-IIA family hydrolase [Armatimonadota bacterium]MDR7568199.1 HAD-IIA family hydrolase [Armatimonadota bacterium]MDR7602102.1 HAD-IIA family hydrolase [Armatimonadota bacterium]
MRESVRWLKAIRGVVLDLDGVVYRGETPLPGAVAFLEHLRRTGLPFVFATNNATRIPEQYAERLARMGIPVTPAQVVTSASVAAEYLRTRVRPGTPVYAIGGEGLRSALREAGMVLSEDPEGVAFVVVGLDVEFTYAKLRAACRAIRRGAGFVATNRDPVLPVGEDLWPGAGSLVAAIEVATGKAPVVLGKPEPPLLEAALRRLGVPAAEALMIGDQLGTDIAGGVRMGMRTVLVLSGVSREAEEGGVRPDLVVEDLADLLSRWPREEGAGRESGGAQ